MEKEMLVVAKFKEGEGKFEKFMGFMQSPEGLAERKKVAIVEKTMASVTPDKSAVMFKIHCTDEACLLYTSPSPRDLSTSRMPSSA